MSRPSFVVFCCFMWEERTLCRCCSVHAVARIVGCLPAAMNA